MPATPDAIGEGRADAGVDNFAVAPHAAGACAGSLPNDSTVAFGLAVRFGPPPDPSR